MKNGTGWTSRMGAGLGSAFRLSDWGMRQTWWATPAAAVRVRRRAAGMKGSNGPTRAVARESRAA